MEKVPCEYCGNTEYQQLFKYVKGKPFCTHVCMTLHREEQEMLQLELLRRAVEAARTIH